MIQLDRGSSERLDLEIQAWLSFRWRAVRTAQGHLRRHFVDVSSAPFRVPPGCRKGSENGSRNGPEKGAKMDRKMEPKRERKGDLNDILINNTNDESP